MSKNEWSVVVEPGYHKFKTVGLTRSEAMSHARYATKAGGGGFSSAAVYNPHGELVKTFYAHR